MVKVSVLYPQSAGTKFDMGYTSIITCPWWGDCSGQP
jgi:hypothetical protein